MGLFGALIKVGVDTIKLPVSVIKDVVTLGGEMNGHGSYTAENLEQIKEDAEEADK